MVSESSLNLKEIIGILKRETTPNESHKYAHEKITLDNGSSFWRKDDFDCRPHWQKVPLYEIEAHEFLLFAKQDLLENSEKGRVNALSNANRAIRCRIDECLTLLNLMFFASREKWKLSYKMLVLKTFDIPALDILKNWVTSKRNLLEHEYLRPRNQQEVQDTIDLAEFFLRATDQEVKRGYLSSATITCIALASEDKNEDIASYTGMWSHEYKLNFNLESGTLVLTHSYKDWIFTGTSRIKAWRRAWRRAKPTEKDEPVILTIHDCTKEDIKELMLLLRQKGKRVS